MKFPPSMAICALILPMFSPSLQNNKNVFHYNFSGIPALTIFMFPILWCSPRHKHWELWCRYIHQGWVSHDQLLFALSPVVVLCDDLHFFFFFWKTEDSLMRDSSHTYLLVEGYYLVCNKEWCCSRKFAVVYTFLLSMTSPAAENWLGFKYQAWVLTCWVSLKYN